MPSVLRLTQVECPHFYLVEGDRCYYYGEYTSHGGFGASDTNNWINNLKKKPTASQQQLYYKDQAVTYWANILRQLVPPQNTHDITFVTIPGSKPVDHPDYDPRMDLVLRRWAGGDPLIDIRRLLVQTEERKAQHEDDVRRTPEQLLETLAIDHTQLTTAPRPNIVIVDDVITRGASYKAAHTLLEGIDGVQTIVGLFLAKNIHQPPPPVVFGPNVFNI